MDVQKAQNDLQTASDAVNASMEEYKTQRAAADAAAAASAAAAQAQSQTQGQTQQQTQEQTQRQNLGGSGGTGDINKQPDKKQSTDNKNSTTPVTTPDGSTPPNP